MSGDAGEPDDGESVGGEPSGARTPAADDGSDERDEDRGTGGSVEPPTVADHVDRTRGEGPIRRLRTAEEGPLLYLRELLTSVALVAAVGLVLFAVSGVWPPMVAVESGSMEPHMHRGDLVLISEPGRYVPQSTTANTGVVTRAEAKAIDYRTFGGFGSVVVYDPPTRRGPPVIHRAHFWVEDGENWYDEANPEYVRSGVDSCEELRNCPAPHAGFVTKGDNNPGYDQVLGISGPVKPEWVVGVAHVRVPLLGYVRLWISGEFRAVPGLSVGPAPA